MQAQYKRDTTTGFITNNDESQYQQILLLRQQRKEKKDIEHRLYKLEQQLANIETSLQTLLSGK